MTKYTSPRKEGNTATLGQPRRSNVPSLTCAFSAAATTGGTVYSFGVFANDLKRSLHLSQMQLGTISGTLFIAGVIGFLPGLVVDRMKPRFSMATGGICGAIFTMTYYVVCKMPDLVPVSHPVAVLSLLAVGTSLSCGLIIGSVFKLALLCGGAEGKGPAVGVAKGFTGLGSGIYATIFEAVRAENETTLDFLPVIAFSFIICAAMPALFLLPTKEEQQQHTQQHLYKIETTPLHFRTMYATLFILCCYIVTSAVCDIWDDDDTNSSTTAALDKAGRQYGKAALILTLWLGPIVSLLFLPRKEEEEEDLPISFLTPLTSTGTGTYLEDEYGSSESAESYDEEFRNPSLEYEEEETDRDSEYDGWKELREKEETSDFTDGGYQIRTELSLTEMLQTPSAWLMLWTCVILVGSGTATTNNMGQMVEALGFSDKVTPATLAIFSVGQSASRIVTGVVSEAALKWKNVPPLFDYNYYGAGDGSSSGGVPRPFFLVVASCIALFAHLLLVFFSTSLPLFVIGCTISAIAFGMAWPLMVLIVGDVFGLEHHGANYMFYDGATKGLGTLFLSTYVAASVYEAHVDKDEDGLTCYGDDCFRGTHVVTAGLAVTCIVASFFLCHTARYAYCYR